MSQPSASFPTSVWDGSSAARSNDRTIDRGAGDYRDYDRVVSEIIKIQQDLTGVLVRNRPLANATPLATTATVGYPMLPTVAGTPTGVPAASTGLAPMVYDTTANKLWIYNGSAWKFIAAS